MIYLEGKKSTPVRTGAPVRELATGRAGVEFLLDAGDVVACSFNVATGDWCRAQGDLATDAAAKGWGGSGREGKVS